MSQPSDRYTTEEIVASIKIGIGVSLSEVWTFCFEDFPELHNRFSTSLLVTIEMLLGRIVDIENQVFPVYLVSSNKDNSSFLATPKDMSGYINMATQSVHKRIEKFARIGFRPYPELNLWFELGSAMGRHITTLKEEDWTNLESQYREIFQDTDPSPYLDVLVRNFEQQTFLEENRTQSIIQIRTFAEVLKSTDPARGTEQSIVTAARLKFTDLTDKEILVIRSLLSLRGKGQGQQFKGKEILTELIKGQYDGVPDNWEFVENESKPNPQFKDHLSNMVKRGIILSRPYRLGHWSGLPQ